MKPSTLGMIVKLRTFSANLDGTDRQILAQWLRLRRRDGNAVADLMEVINN